jgi:acyl dehydratase
MSAMGGFEVPILHGLCFFGFTARICQQGLFKDEPDLMKEMVCRFTSHVLPGETLIVKAWKDGNTIIYETSTKERKLVVC